MFYNNCINYMNNNSIYICNIDRTNQLDQRILERNVPSEKLDLLLSSRPQATKYSLLPTVDNNQCINSDKKYLPYDVAKIFNPGNTKGHYSGFAAKVNDESILRNQIYALQKFPQAAYIPSSNSDLYNYTIPNNNSNNLEQLYPDLFKTPVFSNNNKNPRNLGNNLFNNHTRQQLKNT